MRTGKSVWILYVRGIVAQRLPNIEMRIPPLTSRPAPPRSDFHVASKKIGTRSAGCQSRCGRSTIRTQRRASKPNSLSYSFDSSPLLVLSFIPFLSGEFTTARHFLFWLGSSSSVAQTDKSSISFALPIPFYSSSVRLISFIPSPSFLPLLFVPVPQRRR